jgi:phosphoglucosamine mutase
METTSTGDRIITALQVLAAMRSQNCSLADMRRGLIKYPQVLLNVNIAQHNYSLEKPNIQQAVKTVEKELGSKGRVLLRRSGTEPVIRIMVEGEIESHVKQLAEHLANVLKADLDSSSLNTESI